MSSWQRFLASFGPALCRLIEVDGVQAGFILIRPEDNYGLLDHLYILPEHQKKGIGAAVLWDVFADAYSHRMPSRVGTYPDSIDHRALRDIRRCR